MTDLLPALVLTSMTCCGLHLVSENGHKLTFVKKGLRSLVDRGLFPEVLAKPLLLCVTCMGSVWGVLGFQTFVTEWSWPTNAQYVQLAFFCLALSFLNTALSTAFAVLQRTLTLKSNGDLGRDPVQHPQPTGRPRCHRRPPSPDQVH